MYGVILRATNSFFQKDMTFCRSIYVKKVTKLLAFIFERITKLLLNIHIIAYAFAASAYLSEMISHDR